MRPGDQDDVVAGRPFVELVDGVGDLVDGVAPIFSRLLGFRPVQLESHLRHITTIFPENRPFAQLKRVFTIVVHPSSIC